MSIASVALVTIGQTPRPDLAMRFESVIPASARVEQAGLLDGMSRADVEERYAVRPGEMPLVTKLHDGQVVSISAGRVHDALRPLFDRLSAGGADAIVLMCTGQFSGLRGGQALVLQPDTIVPAVLSALVHDGRIGVILPMREQIGAEPGKWDRFGITPLYGAASPYDADSQPLEKVGRDLVAAGARALVLDCMGFDDAHEQALASVVDVPVIVSNKVMAGVLASLF